MTKPKRTPKPFLADRRLEEENRRLRLKVEQLEEQVRAERKRADQHADEVAFLRQGQVNWARNGRVH